MRALPAGCPELTGQAVVWGQFTMAMRYLLIAFLLQITVDYYRQKELLKKAELEKINAELNFLKAQLNPHFLFNTLNNPVSYTHLTLPTIYSV